MMLAWIVKNIEQPEECDSDVVYAASSADALAHVARYYSVDDRDNLTCRRCEAGDRFVPPHLATVTIAENPDALEACGITPYEWSRCDNCDAWHQGGDDYCAACWTLFSEE